jgi:phage gpG-like protein
MITGYLIGDKALVARMRAAWPLVKTDLDATVERLGYLVQGTSQRDWLAGPRPERLGVVTGRLRASIAVRFESTPTTSYAYVGTNVGYGIAWEMGFSRKVGAGARGGPRTLSGRALSTYFAKHPPGLKQVAARPFLRPALAQDEPQIVREITEALTGAAAKALG